MGGLGSGRSAFPRTTTDNANRVDIRFMRKEGLLRDGCSGTLNWSVRGKQTGSIDYRVTADSVILQFRHRSRVEDWQDVEQTVVLDRTPCNYGGERLWFLCPNCHRRVAVLYGPGAHFLCRHCYGLPYASQSESKADRLRRKARKIRERLGGATNLTEPVELKPKGMQWKTFERLRREERAASQASIMEMPASLKRYLGI